VLFALSLTGVHGLVPKGKGSQRALESSSSDEDAAPAPSPPQKKKRTEVENTAPLVSPSLAPGGVELTNTLPSSPGLAPEQQGSRVHADLIVQHFSDWPFL
jgi:hypothetical protein